MNPNVAILVLVDPRAARDERSTAARVLVASAQNGEVELPALQGLDLLWEALPYHVVVEHFRLERPEWTLPTARGEFERTARLYAAMVLGDWLIGA